MGYQPFRGANSSLGTQPTRSAVLSATHLPELLTKHALLLKVGWEGFVAELEILKLSSTPPVLYSNDGHAPRRTE